MRHPSAKKVASDFTRKGAKSVGGKAGRFLAEAAAGAKPLIDAEPMAEALSALGWEVTPSVEGKVVEGRAAWVAIDHVQGMLRKKVPGHKETWWQTSGRHGLARFSIVSDDKKVLGAVRQALNPLTKKTRPGEIGVTLRENHPFRGRGVLVGKPSFLVFVWINVNVWSLKNPRAKGTGRKPVSLMQKYNANLKLESTNGVKAGQLWNSLYTRGLKAEAEAYMAEHGKDVPSAEELETPEEKIKRRFDQEVKKTLMGFTDKQFDAVVKDYEAYYKDLLDRFLKAQDKAYKEWKVERDKAKAEGRRVTRFTMMGAYKDPTHWKQKMVHIQRFLEWDKKAEYDAPLYKRVGSWKGDVAKSAKSTVTQIRDGFVNKNTMKLSVIVTGKGNLDKIEVLHWARSNFEGEILFKFKDGSSFQVRNKTVSKISSRGTWFSQYPTTFHHVILPNGKKMSSPSEARMIKVFAEA